MEWSWPESVSSDRQRVMNEPVHGRQMTNQLRGVIRSDERSAEGLVTKIFGSLTNTLVILNGSEESNKEEVISQVQTNSNTSAVTASASAAGADSSSRDVVDDDAIKSEDSNEESLKSTETFKDRRNSYKRRKLTSHSWTKDTLELVDDGHAWRKYGQKMILNTTHPRNYFRCTHKFDQGCKATKHVQKINDKPQLFRTTYYGNHTCTGYLRDPELILDCSSRQDTCQNMIRFDSTDNALTCKREHHPFFSGFKSMETKSVKEDEMIIPSSDHVNHHNQSSSSSDYFISPGLGLYESSDGPINEFSSRFENDVYDVISRIMAGYFDNEVDLSYEF